MPQCYQSSYNHQFCCFQCSKVTVFSNTVSSTGLQLLREHFLNSLISLWDKPTEFITNIHFIKCKLLQLTRMFLGEKNIYSPPPWLLTWPLLILHNLFHQPNSYFIFRFVFVLRAHSEAQKQPCFENDERRRLWSQNLHSCTSSTNNEFLMFVNNNHGLQLFK